MLKYIFLISLVFFVGCSSVDLAVVDGESFNETTLLTQDFLDKIAMGEVEGAYIVHKFGANDNIGTTLAPVTISGFYRTPTTATSLEVLSNDVDDTSTGTGARTLLIQGLNSSGEFIQEYVSLNGTSAVSLTNQYIRVWRWLVYESGSYANHTTPSQQGTITLRETGGGQTWSNLNVVNGGFGVGQSEIGVYSIQKGYTCWLLKKVMSVNSVKTANIYFFQRQNITDTTAPYGTMRLVEKHIGVVGVHQIISRSAITKFPELTDVGFMAHTDSGTAEVSVEFEIVCLNNEIFGLN